MSNQIINRPIEILLVEDSPADIRLTQEALKDGKIINNLHIAKDGLEAISFLEKEADFTNVPRPDIILLDLNLPKKDGTEVLSYIKNHPRFKQIPVVVLTTSDATLDILLSYNLHANAYITKPVALDQFINAIRAIENFWLSIVELPTKKESLENGYTGNQPFDY